LLVVLFKCNEKAPKRGSLVQTLQHWPAASFLAQPIL
jgi:hypothetical protein